MPEDRAVWDEIASVTDVYYTPEYVSVFADVEGGVGRAYLFEDTVGNRVLYPFVCRDLSILTHIGGDGHGLRDITTPYGYGGPCYVGTTPRRAEVMQAFRRSFHEYCLRNGIVSEFVRYHPLLGNHRYEADAVDIAVIRTTVVMHVTSDEQTTMAQMPAKARNMVRRAMSAGVTVVVNETPSLGDLQEFISLYVATMIRRHAEEFYMFSSDVIQNMFDRMGRAATLFTAYSRDGVPVSSAIILRGVRDGRYIHYHLSGSDPELMPPGTNNLLLMRAAVWGASVGANELHLGGGYSEGDSLFKFKAGMSRDRRDFAVGKVVHDRGAYDRLTDAATVRTDHSSSTGFFPSYRLRRQ